MRDDFSIHEEALVLIGRGMSESTARGRIVDDIPNADEGRSVSETAADLIENRAKFLLVEAPLTRYDRSGFASDAVSGEVRRAGIESTALSDQITISLKHAGITPAAA